MRRDAIEELHYITPIANLSSILTHGIVSHRRAQNLPHASVARLEIQDVRATVVIPAGRRLHDYVNLYFHARNPMMCVRRDEHADLCVVRIRPDILDVSGVVIADQNAASGYARWAAAPQGVAIVDRDLVFARSWEHPGDQILEWRHRLAKCAEVLVPDAVAPAFIVGIYVSCPETQDRVRDTMPRLPVMVNADLFFRCRRSRHGNTDRHLTDLTAPGMLTAPHSPPQERLDAALPSRAEEMSRTGRHPDDAPTIRPGWIALVEILARIEREPHRWPIGRVSFQKIAYFASELGIPTGFHHTRGSNGPFSADVKPPITHLINNGLVQEERRGGLFILRTGPAYPDAAGVYRTELKEWEPLIDRVADLFLRMRTRESSIAATVFFTAMHLTAQGTSLPFEMAIFDAVKDWMQGRRPPLMDKEIGAAIRHLNILGWVTARPSAGLPLPASDRLVCNDFDQADTPVIAG